MEEDKKISQTNQADESKIRSTIRTFESDAAKALREKNASIGSVFLAEQKKKVESSPVVNERPASHGGLFFLLGIVFILLAGGLSYGAYLYLKMDRTIVPVERDYKSAVIEEKKVLVQTENIARSEIIGELVRSKEEIREKSGVFTTFIFIRGEGDSEEQLETDKVVERLGLRLPGRLLRGLDAVHSLGVRSLEDSNESYLVFTINSYEQAFAGMLEWEKIMFDDLAFFFDSKKTSQEGPKSEGQASTTPSSFVSTSTIATSSSVEEKVVSEYLDSVIKNKDVRILKRNDTVSLIYGFPDRRTLVIAESEDVFQEVIERLSPDRFKTDL